MADDKKVISATAIPDEDDYRIEPVTTRGELWGFWLYNSAMSAVGQMGRLIVFPLILQVLTRANGTFDGHPNIKCTEESTAILNKEGIISGDVIDPAKLPACIIKVAGTEISNIGYINYILGFAVLIQAILFVGLASFADYGPYRKKLLVGLGIGGAVSCMAMPIAHTPELYWLASMLVILITVLQAVSYIFLDGYLPLLARNDPMVINHPESRFGGSKDPNYNGPVQTYDERAASIQTYSNVASFATGFGAIFIGAATLFVTNSNVLFMEFLITACGVYWLALGIFSWARLQSRPGPPIPSGQNYLVFSIKEIGITLSKFRELPNTFKYILAFFFYGDGMSTLAQISILFSSDKLGMQGAETLFVALMFPVTSLIGNVVLLKVQSKFHVSSKSMVIFCVYVAMIIPLYAALGFFNLPFGLVKKWEAYAAIGWYGFAYGAVTTFGKVMFTELIPKGSESRFFGLAALADRGSSWIGSILVGAVSAATKDIRYGMVSILVLFVIGLPILYLVDVEKGIVDARAYAIKHNGVTFDEPTELKKVETA
ncbi:autophagy-related protein 22-like protein [Entophlyctis helioformis]|nr:autophagy-related protein 22-like protein [Entophlyctis helioformis]